MTNAFYILAAFLIGAGGATQTAMLGTIGRDRGSFEASWISLLSTLVGLGALLLARGFRSEIDLPSTLHRSEVWIFVIALAVVLLVLSMRGIAPGYAVVGLFGLAFVVGAAILIPEIGVGQFAVAATAGTLLAGVALDHGGAFGIDVRPLTAVRLAGVSLALIGALLVRADG